MIVASAFAVDVTSVGVAVHWELLVLRECLICLTCSANCLVLSSAVGYNVDNRG